MLALAGSSSVGDFVDFQPIDSALVRKNEEVRMSGGDDHVLNYILGSSSHPDAPLAAARLSAIGVDRSSLQVPAPGNRHGHVLNLNQVFQPDIAGILNDLGTALVPEFLLALPEFLADQIS